jgi:hypothetical protein
MVSKVITRLEDDLDGSEAAETIQFMVDNVEYEIDLSEPNANRFRNSFSEFVSHARKVGGRRRSAAKSFGGVDTKDVRAWAQANGVEVSERGRISADVLDKYRAAGH